jgi:predicted metal-dependent peptidase
MQKIAKAKSRIVLRSPFFASLLLGMPIVESATLNPPTMATDGKTIWFHPGAVMKWSVDEVCGVLVHEVSHVAYLHPYRRGNREPRKANRAMDEAINHIIKASGFDLPAGHLDSPAYRGKSFEEIYNLMPDDQGQGGGGQGTMSGDQFDDCMPAPGDAAQQAQAEAETKIKIKQAANAAKAMGKLPGALADLVDEVLKPKVDWREELRRFMTQVRKDDQSWNRGQRRFLAQGLYLPAMHNPSMGPIVIGLDTSGSVFDRAPEFLAEIQAICEDCSPEKIVVLHVDSKVQRMDEYEPGDTIAHKVCGGGGTDLRTGFRWVEAHDVQPSVMVWLTDLETPFDEVPPEFPVIWVSTEKHTPPWGDVVYL